MQPNWLVESHTSIKESVDNKVKLLENAGVLRVTSELKMLTFAKLNN